MRNKALFVLIPVLLSFPTSIVVGEEMEGMHPPHKHRHMKSAELKNPVAKTEKSIAQGRMLYEKHCIACHGESGKGGIGPHLTGPERIHGSTDGEIFHVITDGVKGTSMKAFKKEFTDDMRWDLVNYITSLSKKAVD